MKAETILFDSEPIVGWRAWRVRYADGFPASLESISVPLKWPARKPMRAHCLHAWGRRRPWSRHALDGHGSAPVLGHDCGIYATRTPQQAYGWSRHFAQERGEQRVVGRVSLWGRIIRHSDGWRAELAYPKEFVLPPSLAGGADPEALTFWLEARYGVPASVGGPLWEDIRPPGVRERLLTAAYRLAGRRRA